MDKEETMGLTERVKALLCLMIGPIPGVLMVEGKSQLQQAVL